MKLAKAFTASLLIAAFAASPAALFAAEKKKEEKKEEKKSYPLTTCVVSDEKLGEMGDPYVFKHEGREVKLCCKSCQTDFKKDPAKYLKKLDDAEKKAKK